jgi:ligand-binding SRPBCC domain-containing protein
LPIIIQAGTQIKYKIRWRGIPLDWTTTIAVWAPPHEFIDEQTNGPYQHFRHRHVFEAADDGTVMTDVVHYALPWGPLGSLMHTWIIRRDLATIFAFRGDRIAQLMGVPGAPWRHGDGQNSSPSLR